MIPIGSRVTVVCAGSGGQKGRPHNVKLATFEYGHDDRWHAAWTASPNAERGISSVLGDTGPLMIRCERHGETVITVTQLFAATQRRAGKAREIRVLGPLQR